MNALRSPAPDTLDDLPLRPPVRIRPGVMAQRWDDLAIISWAYEAEHVQRLLPLGLEVDTFDDAAWVSLVPFRLTVRLPGLPAVPWASRFPEINVRTYVRGPDGRRGIWFLSLDASRFAAVVVARRSYRLPYMWGRATMGCTGDLFRYAGRRRWPRGAAAWDLAVEVGGDMAEVDGLHRFLTARWRLLSARPLELPARSISFVATTVDHPPWPLRQARLAEGRETLLRAAGLPGPTIAPTVAFCPGVAARFSAREPVNA
ncbi:MAG: DUF2071 domain-containing protein [Actinobacteria bacterium]|nr:DUF2071 domain-containing protein [Actinomycetota bacterium]